MGEVVPFPRPSRPEPEPDDMTPHEIEHLARLRKDGRPEDQAFEIIAIARRIRGVCLGD